MPGVVTARESTNNIPSGLLICADKAALALAFGGLIALQPIRWTDDGLLCAPSLAPDDAARALDDCPFPTAVVPSPARGTFPDSPAALVAGWYRRTDRHAPAPPAVRELLQVAGDGFGPGGHPTTTMCLTALDSLPAAPAVDIGCGSGLLTQAWVRLHDVPVLALDLDPAAILQTRTSLTAADLGRNVTTVRGPVDALLPDDLTDRVVFANVPIGVHRTLISRIADPPVAIVASGLRPSEAAEAINGYRRRGLRHVRAARYGRFECHVLVAA